jgi:hypothetical protein
VVKGQAPDCQDATVFLYLTREVLKEDSMSTKVKVDSSFGGVFSSTLQLKVRLINDRV